MSTEPTKIISMAHDRGLQVVLLDIMPPDLWHNWMIMAFSALEKYAEPQEYDEFLERFSWLLAQRVETGVW